MDSSRFRNPNGGRRYLQGLFFELSNDKQTVLYSLKDQDHAGYPSLYRLYISDPDPTEYSFASSCFENWGHWLELCETSWFKPYIEAWRVEKEVKLRATALCRILAVAEDGDNSNSYHANKYLLDGSWKPAGERKRGRPSKDEVKAEITRQAASNKQIEEDMKRIGIN